MYAKLASNEARISVAESGELVLLTKPLSLQLSGSSRLLHAYKPILPAAKLLCQKRSYSYNSLQAIHPLIAVIPERRSTSLKHRAAPSMNFGFIH